MNRKFSNLTFIWIGAGDDNVLYVFKANRDTTMAILRIKKCPQLLVLRRGLAYRFRWTVAFTVGGGFCRWTMLKQNPARLEVTLFGCPVKSRFAVAVLQQGIGFVRQEELQDRFAAHHRGPMQCGRPSSVGSLVHTDSCLQQHPTDLQVSSPGGVVQCRVARVVPVTEMSPPDQRPHLGRIVVDRSCPDSPLKLQLIQRLRGRRRRATAVALMMIAVRLVVECRRHLFYIRCSWAARGPDWSDCHARSCYRRTRKMQSWSSFHTQTVRGR